MAIPKFEDFNKRVSDLFKDDFPDKTSLKIKHNAPAGVSVTSETECNCNDSSARHSLLGKITLKWKHASGFALDKLQFQNGKPLVTETSLVGVAPGLKFTFKGDDGDKGKGELGVEYTSDNATIAGDLDVVHLARANLSAVFGYQKFRSDHQFLLGGCMSVNLPGEGKGAAGVDEHTVAAGYFSGPLFASLGSRRFNTVDVNMRYQLDKYLFGARVSKPLTQGSDYAYSVGGICNCSPATAVRVKIFNDADSKGAGAHSIAASVSHTPAAGVNVIGSLQSTLDNLKQGSKPKLGLQITLG